MEDKESGFNSRGLNSERADKLKDLLNTIFVKNKAGLDENFTQKAAKKKDADVASAEHVPFNCFWPTYDSMTDEQLDWYFHWRGRVREGIYLPTDISYIFIHLYELINNVESDSPTESLRKMCLIWQNYRQTYRRLDKYLVPWIEDYMIINMSIGKTEEGGVYEAGEIVRMADLLQSVTDERLINLFPDYAIGRYLNDNLSNIPVELLSQFSDYEFYTGEFFTHDKDDLLLKFLSETIRKIDMFFVSKNGEGIFVKYKPDSGQRRHRIPFANAVYDGIIKSIEVPALPYIKHPPLREFMTSVIRFIENCLREQTGFKGRLKRIILDEGVEETIRHFISDEYDRFRRSGIRTVITIDRDKILQLISDSNAVRMMLLENPQDESPAPEIPEVKGKRQFSEIQREILKFIVSQGGSAIEKEIKAKFKDVFIQIEIDGINEIAMDNFNDVLLLDESGIWTLVEDNAGELGLD